jgi:hypothetical protein
MVLEWATHPFHWHRLALPAFLPPLVQMRASQLLFTKLVGMWDSPNWNSDGTWDGQGSGHDYWGTVCLCECVNARVRACVPACA